ncbi:MAG: GIY-YIG nuclease family protein [Parcubacteria group bacterium]|nr:GIY-YIG nuclease family protein [Parcubacteria group bacterium]
MPKQYYVYIATNKLNTVLYTGVTSDLEERMYQHRNKLIPGFTSKYNVNKLVFYEVFPTPQEAIAAEKKIKGWVRKKKVDLIKSVNPNFRDLLDRDSSLRSE